MRNRWMKSLLWIACLGAMIATPAMASSPEAVDNAIKLGVEALYKAQKNGHWESTPSPPANNAHGAAGQWGGTSSLAIYALLTAGERPQNNKQLADAVEWLKKAEVTGMYALGVRANVWHLLPGKDRDPVLREVMSRDARLLALGNRTAGVGSPFRGKNHYFPSERTYDNSASQYGVLGMWALEQSGIEVPDQFWDAVEKAWKKDQLPDGRWSYRQAPDAKGDSMQRQINMTGAGLATLFIAQDYLRSMDGVKCTGNIANEPIDKGMAWMEKNLAANLQHVSMYGWYGIERIGVASGYKYFGTMDWYKAGAEKLVKDQRNGTWKDHGEVVGTAFGVVFLSRGRAPVVMNKLAYNVGGKEGNWNQRPRDAANVTRYTAKQMERDLNWQIVNLRVSVDDLHDAPILYIAGNQTLNFSKEEVEKIRQFVEQGGLVLGHADCDSNEFAKSFQQLGMSIHNKEEWRSLDPAHPIYTRQQFQWRNWKAKPVVQGLSNGVRELFILLPKGDPGRSWQQRDDRSKEEQFQLLSNIFLYAVEGRDLRFKGSTYIVTPDPKATVKKTIKVARLDVGGNPDPEPGGWRRLSAILRNTSGTAIETSFVKTDALKDHKIAHLTGTDKVQLTEAQLTDLKKFVEAGGTLIVDAAGGDQEFGVSVRDQLMTLFGNAGRQLQDRIPPSDPLFAASGKPLDDVSFRPFARARVERGQRHPLIRGMKIGDRWAVLFSDEDLSTGLVGMSIDGITGYTPASAVELMSDMVLYAANGPAAATKPATAPATKPAGK